MSISAIGTSSDMLASLLGRIWGSTDASSDTTSTDTLSASTDTDTATTGTDTALTGSGKGDLSSQIINLLTMLQNQETTSSSDTTSTDSTTDGTSDGTSDGTTATDGLSQLFSAIDSDGDGSITQSEMESYITNLGGTTEEADSLFSSIDSDGTGSVTTDDLAKASGPPPGPPPDDAAASSSETSETTDTSETSGTSSSSGSDEEDYDIADTNKDGYVSTSEYNAYYGVSLGGDESLSDSMGMGMGARTDQSASTMTLSMQNAFSSAANIFNPISMQGTMNMVA